MSNISGDGHETVSVPAYLCRAERIGSICSLVKWADTIFWLRMPTYRDILECAAHWDCSNYGVQAHAIDPAVLSAN